MEIRTLESFLSVVFVTALDFAFEKRLVVAIEREFLVVVCLFYKYTEII
jgi:hypothetical protein